MVEKNAKTFMTRAKLPTDCHTPPELLDPRALKSTATPPPPPSHQTLTGTSSSSWK